MWMNGIDKKQGKVEESHRLSVFQIDHQVGMHSPWRDWDFLCLLGDDGILQHR